MAFKGMTALEELVQLITEKGRTILVAENPVNLHTLESSNSIFVLQLPVESHSAGGRTGGFGERRLQRIYSFHYENGVCHKVFETDKVEKLEKFELPYHAAGISVILADGTERVLTGVVDQEIVQSYKQIL